MNKFFTFLFLFSYLFCFSQREADNWYFGDKGGLHFNNGTINVSGNSQMTTPAGCSSISNSKGELLFYSNGETVWNKNHKIMINGKGLAGQIENTQSTLIIPKPGDDNTYYIITTRKESSSKISLTPGVYYSEVLFSSTNSLGKITTKNRLLRNTSSERITAVHHKNGNDIWLITFGNKNSLESSPINTFMSYKIDNTGINFIPVISEQKETVVSSGNMKVSPNGKYIAIAEYQLFIYIYDFNTENAEISYRRKIGTSPAAFVFGKNYGVEFSQDSKTLYFSCDGGGKSYVYQYSFLDKILSIKTRTRLFESTDYNFHSLQLSSNGSIYLSKTKKENNSLEYSRFLSKISFPEKRGKDANFIENAIDLGGEKSYKGLPNFIQSYFRNRIKAQNGCVSEIFNFAIDSYIPITSINWDFGDGNTSIDINPSHLYNLPGKYISKAKVKLSNLQEITLYKEVEVFSLPKLKINTSLIQCDVNNDGLDFFNLYNIDSKISLSNSPLKYYFYETKIDSENDINRINTPESYQNIGTPQTIFVRAINENECSEIGSFEIISSFVKINEIQPIITCEDSDNIIGNGIGHFDLLESKKYIINQLNLLNILKIGLYKTLKDAQTTTNELDDFYISNSSEIWLRIDNNTGCGGIKPIKLIVNSSFKNKLKDTYTICIIPSAHSPVIATADSTNDKFEWKNHNGDIVSTNDQFILNQIGDYSLTVYKTENGIECSNSTNFTVTNPTPPKIIRLDVEPESELNNSIFITVNGNSNYEFSLDNISFFNNGLNHTFNNIKPGVKTVYVRDINNCEPPIQTSIGVIGFSKFFTPNNDTINDVWVVKGATQEFFKTIDIYIFDRFGKIVYTFNNKNADKGWNGTYNNKILPPNDYWFHAKLIDFNNKIIEEKGHFSLRKE